MGQEFDFAAAFLPGFGRRGGGLISSGEILIQAGEQLARSLLARAQQIRRHLFCLRDQQRTPVQADQVVGAARDHLPRDGQHVRAIAQRLPGGEIQFLPRLLELGLGILGLPLVEQCQPLLRRCLGPDGEHQIVLVAVGPFGGAPTAGFVQSRRAM